MDPLSAFAETHYVAAISAITSLTAAALCVFLVKEHIRSSEQKQLRRLEVARKDLQNGFHRLAQQTDSANHTHGLLLGEKRKAFESDLVRLQAEGRNALESIRSQMEKDLRGAREEQESTLCSHMEEVKSDCSDMKEAAQNQFDKIEHDRFHHTHRLEQHERKVDLSLRSMERQVEKASERFDQNCRQLQEEHAKLARELGGFRQTQAILLARTSTAEYPITNLQLEELKVHEEEVGAQLSALAAPDPEKAQEALRTARPSFRRALRTVARLAMNEAARREALYGKQTAAHGVEDADPAERLTPREGLAERIAANGDPEGDTPAGQQLHNDILESRDLRGLFVSLSRALELVRDEF